MIQLLDDKKEIYPTITNLMRIDNFQQVIILIIK
jgi:hypothetical protein